MKAPGGACPNRRETPTKQPERQGTVSTKDPHPQRTPSAPDQHRHRADHDPERQHLGPVIAVTTHPGPPPALVVQPVKNTHQPKPNKEPRTRVAIRRRHPREQPAQRRNSHVNEEPHGTKRREIRVRPRLGHHAPATTPAGAHPTTRRPAWTPSSSPDSEP